MALPTTGLVLHNRVADAGTCFKTAGNPPSGAAADGEVVLEWAKESGASVDYAFGQASNDIYGGYGTFDADGMGSAAGLYLNGRASPEDRQGLVTRNLAGSANVGGDSFYAVLAPFTWAVAFRAFGVPASGRGMIFGTTGAQAQLYVSTDQHLYVRWFNFGAGVANYDLGAIDLDTNYSVVLRYTRSGGDQIQVYLNDAGTPVFSSAVPAAQDHSSRSFAIGGDIAANADYFNGAIGEIAVYNSYLTGTDLSDLMDYLVAAWPDTAPGGGGGGGASAAPKFNIASAPNRGIINGRRPCWA